jgi:RNA polymerase sigma-70 factor (ECF subfamily)
MAISIVVATLPGIAHGAPRPTLATSPTMGGRAAAGINKATNLPNVVIAGLRAKGIRATGRKIPVAFSLNFSRPRRNLSSDEPAAGPGRHGMTDPADRLYERILVLRCQAGDEAAFAEILERYGPRMRYFVRKLLGEADVSADAEDVLQDVWLDVYRKLGRLTDAGALAAWLYRIARDRAYRVLRKRRPGRVALDAEVLTDDAEEGSFSAEDAARIHAALRELEPEHREVLMLRFLEEMTYEDIARVTGCPIGTVRSRLYYGKLALRRRLKGDQRDE